VAVAAATPPALGPAPAGPPEAPPTSRAPGTLGTRSRVSATGRDTGVVGVTAGGLETAGVGAATGGGAGVTVAGTATGGGVVVVVPLEPELEPRPPPLLA
jgi:hypothetical protein